MRFVCRTCGVVREAEDALLQQASEIVCGSCGSAMTPDQGQAASRAPRSRVAALGLSEQWFVTDDAGRRGPYSAAQLARMLERGELGWTSQVWREGLKDWRPARRDDLLVFAVASVRGMASDTSRLETVGDLLLQEDTRVEGERPERFAESERAERAAEGERLASVVVEGERPERAAPSPTSAPSPPRVAALSGDAGDPAEDTRPTQLPQPVSWPLRHSTPLIAVGAFAAGALLTQLSHRFVTAGAPDARDRRPPAVVPSEPRAAPTAAKAAALTLRDAPVQAPAPAAPPAQPDRAALDAELARLQGPVHRCVRRFAALEISLVVDGDSGRVDPARVRAKGVRAGRLACIARALASLEVEPFAAREFALTHRYRW